MKKFGLLGAILLLLYGLGCGRMPDSIADLQRLNQDNMAYLNRETADTVLISANAQAESALKFRTYYFAPWHLKTPRYTQKDITDIINDFRKNPGFGENKQPHSIEWVNQLATLCDLDHYPNTKKTAITLRNSNLRLLPTLKPHFNDFNLPGEGYPFDNLQQSAIWANTPILISHTSADGRWVLAETPFCLGWLPIDDIAYASEAFKTGWESRPLLAIIEDNTTVIDTDNQFRQHTYIGTLLPKDSEKEAGFTCLIAVADLNRNATIVKGLISKSQATEFPYAATTRHVARLANQMINQPYGWGGTYENRDCSAMIRDLFTGFGIWLPRNSDYMRRSNLDTFISLQNLSDSEKEKQIMEKGIPFFTLIWMKGHIMLYIGSFEGRPLVIHNIWGIRTQDIFKGEGRFIIGKTVITTLSPGIELPNFSPKSALISRVGGMILLK